MTLLPADLLMLVKLSAHLLNIGSGKSAPHTGILYIVRPLRFSLYIKRKRYEKL